MNNERSLASVLKQAFKKTSIKKDIMEEGCLSVPKTYGKVKRYVAIKVDALNEKGEKISFPASNLLARVIQHEVDHLDGILFIDHIKAESGELFDWGGEKKVKVDIDKVVGLENMLGSK